MRISIIGVGRLKEKYWQMAIDEYSKRLGKYIKLNIIEVPDEKAPENLSAADVEIVKKNEGDRILKSIKDDVFVIALAIDGKMLSSEELSEYLNERMVRGDGNISFVIGGSLGLSEEVLARANFKLSFSKMTFPHQMMRVVLLEQIYRAIKIMKNEPYHK
ncbi:Ribosomal RNA large subunit methyltransferase H [bioreactor metagenome]|uniref:Ribosomal RNA large subunit methyltransferase H n=1 Tax=bioreactor metagenome TaxID=1076179 RepID=A0A644XVH2_9ZZZZ|nr:23S rRNA (pseudouridine(1915)-N(3))-methyltransferase RlmH [Candidatus Metalachnospira sp.]